jgi:C-terminal processing protease CtpA/Prc
MARRSLLRALVVLLILAVLTAHVTAEATERLVTLARVWAAVKYLDPVMLQKNIDWDGALVRAIPQVRMAKTDDEFARAVGSMLKELDDSATVVVQSKLEAQPSSETRVFRWVGDTLIISAGPYAAAKSSLALYGEVPTLTQELAKAKRVIVDLRFHPSDPAEAGAPLFAISQLRGLSAELVTPPASTYVYHSGYRPQQGETSGGYFSGLMIVPGQGLAPSAAAIAPVAVAFVTDADSLLPPAALALRAAGKAIIVSSAPLDDRAVVNTRTIDLGGRWRALIRMEQFGMAVAADAIAADPLAEALAMVGGNKTAPTAARGDGANHVADPRWAPDPDYRDMVYPDVAHRLLAAFRIWSVINYFYPYKDLIPDWDAALTASIPQFIAAADGEAYAEAVMEFVARVEDGHSSVSGHPALARIIGPWRTPIEVREVEHAFVVTGLQNGLSANADVRVGDLVLSIDGEPLDARVLRLRKYLTASTEIARRNRLAAAALRGPADSIATLTVRGADERIRSVQIPRVQVSQPREIGEPYRLMDGNIGYVDLTRLAVTQVDAMFNMLMDTRAIIFDMRGYPKGTAWSIAPRINTKAARTGAIFRRPQVSGLLGAEEAAAGFFFEQPLPTSDKPKYAGKTVMLIDDRAISQAEHTALFFEAANGTTFIGSPTAGANGDVTNFSVPGGFRIGFTGHDVRHADGRQLQRVGIQPHVHVAPTVAGLRAGRDEVLERAIAFLKQ